jgi:hypothetical protein
MNEAIERAKQIDAEYQPAFGVQVEDEDGNTLWSTEADETEIAPKMRVAAGHGEDRDTGTVYSIDGRMAQVSWDSGVVTPCPIEDLEAI